MILPGNMQSTIISLSTSLEESSIAGLTGAENAERTTSVTVARVTEGLIDKFMIEFQVVK
jgi:hypothetical protein